MRKRHEFRPTGDGLESRLVLNASGMSAVTAQHAAVETAREQHTIAVREAHALQAEQRAERKALLAQERQARLNLGASSHLAAVPASSGGLAPSRGVHPVATAAHSALGTLSVSGVPHPAMGGGRLFSVVPGAFPTAINTNITVTTTTATHTTAASTTSILSGTASHTGFRNPAAGFFQAGSFTGTSTGQVNGGFGGGGSGSITGINGVVTTLPGGITNTTIGAGVTTVGGVTGSVSNTSQNVSLGTITSTTGTGMPTTIGL